MAIDIDTIIAAVQAAQLLKDKDTKAAPQSFDPLLSKFVPLLSDNGAARQVLYGPDGQPLSIVDNKLAVKAAEIEKAIANLQTALLGSQSTAAKQDALAALVGAIDAAAVNDPTKSGAVIALLKGLLARLQTLEGKIDGITDGTTPATTQLTGSKVGVMQSAPVVGERTVTNTAAEMHAGASPLAGRYEMVVLNTSANTVFWGPAGVTLDTGFPLLPNDIAHFKFDAETHIPIYFIADGNFVVKVVELS